MRKHLTHISARELTEADIIRFREAPAVPQHPKPDALEVVSQRHHALARCLALGMKTIEASHATGYTPAQVSLLKNDQLFKELVEFYTSQAVDVFKETAEHLQGMTLEAIAKIRDRIENDGNGLAMKDLIEAVKLGADRTGFGPHSTQTNVTLNLSERMKSARERQAPVIEGRL